MNPKISTKRPFNRRSPTEIEGHRMEIAKLDRRGYNQIEIAEKVGLSQGQVCQELKKLRKMYYDAQMEVLLDSSGVRELTDAQKNMALVEIKERLREMLMELFEAWDKSKEDGEKTVYEQTEMGEKVTKTVEGRLPKNEYMITALKVIERIAELSGIKPYEMTDITIKGEGVWEMLARRIPKEGIVIDQVEEEIRKIEQIPIEKREVPLHNDDSNIENGETHFPPLEQESG
jgi:hypothetical protein